jgi:manganese-dependent inorganic pyrophosphatase
MQANVVAVPSRTPVAEALGIMDDRNIRVLPVLNPDRSCRGLISVFKMSKFFLPAANRIFDSRRVLACVRNVARTLNGKMLFAIEPDREEDLILMIAAMKQESFAQRLPNYAPEKLVVVVGDREEIQRLAIEKRVRLLVITGGLRISDELLAEARRNEVSVIVSPHDSATTAMLARASIMVDHMMHDHFLSFDEDESLSAIQELAAASNFLAFPVLDKEKRVVGIFSKSDFLKKVERQLILVDHNELTQAVHGADKVEIIEVVDHHRIGSLTTQQPILFRNEPVGSTSTIVADCFFRYQVDLPASIAGLLIAGLVSDTLNLTSPTTTKRDVEILEWLEKKAGINAREFTEKLFASGSLLTSKPAPQAITVDCKEYVERGRTFSVAQIEEIGFEQFWQRKAEVLTALANYRAGKGYYFSALLVTDVTTQTSLLLVAGAEPFLAQIDYPEVEPGIHELRSVVSRKKQVLPYLTHCLEKMK